MTWGAIPWKCLLILCWNSCWCLISISGVWRSQTADYQGWVDLPTAFCTMNFSIFQFSSIVKVDANTARSDWGDCVYECGSTIHLPYIRWPVNSLVMLRPPPFFLICKKVSPSFLLLETFCDRWDLSSLAEDWSNRTHPADWVRITGWEKNFIILTSPIFFIIIIINTIRWISWPEYPWTAPALPHYGQGVGARFVNLVQVAIWDWNTTKIEVLIMICNLLRQRALYPLKVSR